MVLGLNLFQQLRSFAGQWWFPWAVASLSAINMFTLVLSAPITMLFLAAVAARPGNVCATAFINALGVSVGAAVLLGIMQVNGTEAVPAAFPGIFSGQSWQNTQAICERWGLLGATFIAAMPIVLHPLLLLGLVSGMHTWVLVVAVLGGRTIKYVVMAQCAVKAPHLLRYFGVSKHLFEQSAAPDEPAGGAPLLGKDHPE